MQQKITSSHFYLYPFFLEYQISQRPAPPCGQVKVKLLTVHRYETIQEKTEEAKKVPMWVPADFYTQRAASVHIQCNPPDMLHFYLDQNTEKSYPHVRTLLWKHNIYKNKEKVLIKNIL